MTDTRNTIRTVRIFVSSPGDVQEERDTAVRVIKQLRRKYIHRLNLEPVLWEELALKADQPFQVAIDTILETKPVDIAIFILWSRLGSKTSIGEKTYQSGTERELDLVLQARETSGGRSPEMIVYVRDDAVSFDERLVNQSIEAKEELIDQKKRLEAFKSEHFFDEGKQENRRAYHTYKAPSNFRSNLRKHLIQMLDEFAGAYTGEALWDINEQGPPFRGLEAFHFEHADVFFGRELESIEVYEALKAQASKGCAFILLSGASGSGKSSLARAGVMPAIVNIELNDKVKAWNHFTFTPGQYAESLLYGLAKELNRCLGDLNVDKLANALVRDPHLAWEAYIEEKLRHKDSDHTRLLILVDQLEEIFTDARINEKRRQQFIEVLNVLSHTGSIWILSTVRSDFYGHCESSETLLDMVGTGGHYSVRLPGADAIRRLITEPAHVAGLKFEKRGEQSLDDVILEEAIEHAELLPLLQYLLLQLYDDRGDSNSLHFKTYERFASYTQNGEELGGLRGALAQKARATMANINPDRRTFHQVMSELVTLSGDDDENAVRQIRSHLKTTFS
jgi:hypothetical protein